MYLAFSIYKIDVFNLEGMWQAKSFWRKTTQIGLMSILKEKSTSLQ